MTSVNALLTGKVIVFALYVLSVQVLCASYIVRNVFFGVVHTEMHLCEAL